MPTNIAEYFSDELIDWTNAINFYTGEMEQVKDKLGEIIRRNSIVDIAEKVEEHQNLLDDVSNKFTRLQFDFKDQDEALRRNGNFVEDTLLDLKTEEQQNRLRNLMQETEKEYIDVKFICGKFILGTLKK